MVTFYGAEICGDCREALALFQEKGFAGYEYVDITASTENLRAFLKLRDTRQELLEAREEGRIGVPCFAREDGSLALDPAQVLAEV